MAVVKGALHSGEASGALGGLSYSKDQYGTNCKPNIYPNDPRSIIGSQERNQANGYCSHQFHNLSLPQYELWKNFSEIHFWKNRLSQVIKLSPISWYLRFCVPARLYFGFEGALNPPEVTQHYTPNFTCEWTVNGILLTFDDNPNSSQCIVVWQHRNLRATQVKYNILQRSHIITYPTESPVLLSGALLAQNDPPGFPVLLSNTYTNLKIRCYNIFGLPSPELRYRIHVS